MSETIVEQELFTARSRAIRQYAVTLKLFIDHVKHLEEADTPEKLAEAIENLRQCKDLAEVRLTMHGAKIGQYRLLNDIRLGKVKVVNPETNEPVKVYFSTLEV